MIDDLPNLWNDDLRVLREAARLLDVVHEPEANAAKMKLAPT